MGIKKLLTRLVLSLAVALPMGALAEVEELNPFDPNVEQLLQEFDKVYEEETGESPRAFDAFDSMVAPRCYRQSCRIWALISKSRQRLYLYVNGRQTSSWLVSTGRAGYETPNFDTHPNGRIYTRYTSRRYPEGDYRGLGNMPYAVFIRGGFAIHGTPEENWPRLGRKASHGCIRQHPDNARYINQLIRSAGVRNTWITVQP